MIFGGRSSEHEVSLVSATSVIEALDKDKYEVIPIGITKRGRWLSSSQTLALLKSGKSLDRIPERVLLPDPTQKGLVEFRSNGVSTTNEPLDVGLVGHAGIGARERLPELAHRLAVEAAEAAIDGIAGRGGKRLGAQAPDGQGHGIVAGGPAVAGFEGRDRETGVERDGAGGHAREEKEIAGGPGGIVSGVDAGGELAGEEIKIAAQGGDGAVARVERALEES